MSHTTDTTKETPGDELELVKAPIAITIETQYLSEPSEPQAQRYVYSYHINITNNTSAAVQLVSRHWIITNARDEVQEVQGIGVVGEQPHIAPGESYSYSSGSVMETEHGTMEGSFQMRDSEGQIFDAEIPLFALVAPTALH